MAVDRVVDGLESQLYTVAAGWAADGRRVGDRSRSVTDRGESRSGKRSLAGARGKTFTDNGRRLVVRSAVVCSWREMDLVLADGADRIEQLTEVPRRVLGSVLFR